MGKRIVQGSLVGRALSRNSSVAGDVYFTTGRWYPGWGASSKRNGPDKEGAFLRGGS